MADFESTSAETSEVAELTPETGAEDQEVAEPESETAENAEHQRTDADASFAEMRRQMQEAQRAADDARAELAELQAQNEARDAAYSRLTGKEDGEIAALAELTGMSEEEIIEEMEAARESAEKDLRISQLEDQLEGIEAERLMQDDLETLRQIDPTLKSLLDLGKDYGEYVKSGLSPEQAYWACKAKEQANRATPPKPVGRVHSGTAEKDYFTDAEIDAMSSDQLTKNWKKIMASWDRRG